MHVLVVLLCRALTEIFFSRLYSNAAYFMTLYSEAVFSVYKVNMVLADKIKIISDKGITVLLC
jgi:hypothetical protein